MKNQGISTKEISRRLGIRKATIISWLNQETYKEKRGWKSGRRIYTDKEENRVASIKRAMKQRDDYFLGAPYVQMNYNKQYPDDSLPSIWFIKDVVKKHDLQTREIKQRSKGKDIVKKLLFPIQSIIKLGKIQQAADFIGKKFIYGRSEPICFFATSYYQWFKLYHVWRILAETVDCAVDCLKKFWSVYPIPNVLRIDNDMTFRGTGRLKAHLGRFLKFLLNLGVTPLFSAAYQSYTNPHIEGHNSTFTQKIWAKHTFTHVEEIDRECKRFNAENKEFYLWKFKKRLQYKSLRYLQINQEVTIDSLRSTKGKKIYFIRFVQCWNEVDNRYGIVVMDRFIQLSEVYNKQYVFVELNLATAVLHVYSEREGEVNQVLQIPFPFTV